MNIIESIFGNLGEEIDSVINEIDILRNSLAEKKSEEKAMEALVDTSENEMRTQSPLYQDEATARHMMEHEVEEYIGTRIGQMFEDKGD